MRSQTSFHPGQLTAIDELNRTLPDQSQVGEHRQDRFTGIFYFLWLGQHGTQGPYNITKILEQSPEAVHDQNHPAWGPPKAYHFWGEPLYGYYLADDAWVLRKHVQLLTNASIDFLVFDTTNVAIYKPVVNKLLAILEEVRLQGFQVPKIVYYTNTRSGETITSIYEEVYRDQRYPELWFYWKGKPLIIGNPDEVNEKIREFFTFRLNQWPNEEAKTNGFPWTEFVRPQRVFYNDAGQKEVINVGVAQHPTIAMSDTPFYNHGVNWGRAFHDGHNDPAPDAYQKGYNIAEQWEFALKEDPQIIFITGWNEWIAMRLPGRENRPILFVDQCTLNFSRDIEPMKGGYNDNYYLQLIDYIRRFKGTTAPLAVGASKTIHLGTDFSVWDEVQAEYRDFSGDTAARSHPGYGDLHYEDHTGRNDFVTMKVARDAENIYFYAKTANPITPRTDSQWMMLFLNVDPHSERDWNGFDYVINRVAAGEQKAVLERCLGGWYWEYVNEVEYAYAGQEFHVKIPRRMLGLDQLETPLNFRFKWADNMLVEGDAMDFYQHGDTAPDGRLSYVFYEA